MSDRKDNSDKTNKRIRDITPRSFAAFPRQPIGRSHDRKRAVSVTSSDFCGNATKSKKRKVDMPKAKTDGDTPVNVEMGTTPIEVVQSTTPPILRNTRQRSATTKVPKSKGATKAPREIAKFPNPSQSDVLLYLCQDFGLQLSDTNSNTSGHIGRSSGGSCRWEGQEFPSIDALRRHLCRTGLVAPSPEWFHTNMQSADPQRYYGGGGELYIPGTKKSRMIADWIRLDIVPVIHRKTASLERLAKNEVQSILRKVGVRATMGHFEMDGEELQWNEVEWKLATFGLSQRLWEHPGATETEKLSMLLYFVDHEVIVLQRESTYVPNMDAKLPSDTRPRRRVVLQSQQVKVPTPTKLRNVAVRSNPQDKAVEEDIVFEPWKSPDERQNPYGCPFFSDNEEEDMPATVLRRPLEPFPPRRKKMRRKSSFRRRKLESDEFVGRCLLTSPDFWDTLGQIRPNSNDFAWGKPIGYRRNMGRAYFDSFELFGKLIRVGSFVKMEGHCYKIISAFQATRSFVGRWNTKHDELQNRGYAYVELAPIKRDAAERYFLFRSDEWNPGHIEGIPTPLFHPNGDARELECVAVTCTELWIRSRIHRQLTAEQQAFVTETDAIALTSRFALDAWPGITNANFLILYANEREFKLGTDEKYTAFDSDDSDDFEDSSSQHIKKGKFNWNEEVKCDLLDNELEPSIMFEGNLLPKKKVDSEHLFETLKKISPLLDACETCDESLKDSVSALRKELCSRTATSRLDDFFTMIRVPAKWEGGIVKPEYAKTVGFSRYKSKIQQVACEHVANREDTVMIAPCGSGKSMVFVHAALNSGGKVNIVIEPLNAIIKSQLVELHYLSAYIDIEQLYSEDDAKEQQVLSSYNRMQMIINDTMNGWTSKPLLIFATPELIEQRLPQLKVLAAEGFLASVTVDEMDMIDRSRGGFRGVYTNLAEKLRQHCEGAKFIFLSGTITNRGLVSLLPSVSIAQQLPEVAKPLLVIHERALADSLSFHVERKVNDEQVAERIVWWIRNAKGPVKCLCYCLTKPRCRKIAQLLEDRGVTSTSVTSEEKSSFSEVLQSFRKGRISVLCCTGVLGRGFHVDDIRFVFHASVPLDLTEYIQQTGRAGRDGKRARCILFYRAQDFSTVRRIKIRPDDPDVIRESVDADIAEVALYAVTNKCRYSQLASSATLEQCRPSDQRCNKTAPCDVCVDSDFQTFDIGLSCVFDSISVHTPWEFNVNQPSLSDDLLQLFLNTKVLEKKGPRQLQAGLNFHHVHEQLSTGAVGFFAKHKTGDIEHDSTMSLEEYYSRDSPEVKIFDYEELHEHALFGNANVVDDSLDPLDHLQVPFLVRFECERARQLKNECESKILDHFGSEVVGSCDCLDACRFLNGLLPRREAGRYESALPRLPASENQLTIDSFNSGSGLYFHGELDANNVIRLLPPERANSRRIFRKFGSHRFLHVKVAGDLPDERVIKKFTQQNVLCGRTYAYLWCKAQKSPQCFVLFAERGFGITDDLSAEQVLDWCIPLELNPDLTIAKELKRMKLAFSKTTPSFVLPEKSVELIDDILGERGTLMTDGAGLLSRGALNEVWRCHSGGSTCCPFSSFQGRIGGFKGMWVLDDSLPGILIKCRRSQLKFNVPMKSLVSATNKCHMKEDSLYDTVEVNSWDVKPEKGFLSVRLVQILERRGVSLDYFLRCADKGLCWLDELDSNMPSSQAHFYDEVRKRHSNIVAMNDKEEQFNDDILFHMASAKLDPSEPYYAAQRRNFVKKTADSMRNKARYPLKDSWHVRMLPDHLQLLKEGEAFVALPDDARGSLGEAKEVLAFRNPSYFDGDLRKLTLVRYDDLLLRADAEDKKPGRVGREWVSKCQGFFRNLISAIVLSTVGSESEADRMSGGDFDGDKAWICFDRDLVEQVAASEPATRPDPPPKDHAEHRLVVDASVIHRIKFARHFKNHQRQLGFLANKLDSALDMFDDFSNSSIIDDIARQAFLQVDHPYQLCAPKSVTMDYLNLQKQPHWSLNQALRAGEQHEKVYRSQKAMGILWDHVETKIERAVSHGNGNEVPNAHILKLADTACTRLDFLALKSMMRKAVVDYKLELKELMRSKVVSLDKVAEKTQERAQAERARLIMDSFDSEDDRTLAAAVLYKECGDSKGFAWKVARDYLILIVVRAQNRGKSALPLIMDPEIDKLAFGRKQNK